MKCIKPFVREGPGGEREAFPCGQCVVCKINKSREWTMRMTAESNYWPHSAFLTLTYADDEQISLDKRDLQLFFKRLRKSGVQFRYYGCGEYGGTLRRPHYHVCLFYKGTLDFTKDLSFGTNNGHLRFWDHGIVNLGTFTKESARYVTDYLLKGIDIDIPSFLAPPFRVMSKGMGMAYFIDNHAKLERYGFFQGGTRIAPPRYFRDAMSSKFKSDALANQFRDESRLIKLGRFKGTYANPQLERNILAKQFIRRGGLYE